MKLSILEISLIPLWLVVDQDTKWNIFWKRSGSKHPRILTTYFWSLQMTVTPASCHACFAASQITPRQFSNSPNVLKLVINSKPWCNQPTITGDIEFGKGKLLHLVKWTEVHDDDYKKGMVVTLRSLTFETKNYINPWLTHNVKEKLNCNSVDWSEQRRNQHPVTSWNNVEMVLKFQLLDRVMASWNLSCMHT